MKMTVSLLVLHLLHVGKGCRSVGVWRDSLCGTVWAEGCLSRGDMMWCVCAEGWVRFVFTRLGGVCWCAGQCEREVFVHMKCVWGGGGMM